jgi:8-oxo-dGTP diphosphatase
MKKTTSSFVIYQEKLLLLLRDNNPAIENPNTWQTIGGFVEAEETFEAAIRREIQEETNLTPAHVEYLGKRAGVNHELAIYVVRLTEQEVKALQLGNEGQALQFFAVDELETLNLSSHLLRYLRSYQSQIFELIRGKLVAPEQLGLT